MALNAKHLLCKHVCSAQTTNDIIPLLSLIPLHTIQDAILDAIRGLDTNTVNEMQYKCLSVTNILPDDLIQHIVSFSDSLGVKYIDKAFNNCYNKNKALELKQREQIIEKYAFNPRVKYGEQNKTWIIHPTRTHLNSEEIANGYQGPLNELIEVTNAVESGDKLLFYDGHYIETEERELSVLMDDNLQLQLIGIGSDVRLKVYRHGEIDVCAGQRLYLKNMKIDIPFYIENAEVSMEDCQIVMEDSFIYVSNDGIFNAKNCFFSGQSESDYKAINMENGSNVNIIGCTFTHHKQTCIWVHHDDESDDAGDTFLKCIGNIFQDNLGYPIVMDKNAQSLDSVIKHNILEGYNGVNGNGVVDTANEIYYILETLEPPSTAPSSGFNCMV